MCFGFGGAFREGPGMTRRRVLRDYQSLCALLMAEIEQEDDIDTRMEMLRDMIRALRVIHEIQQENKHA